MPLFQPVFITIDQGEHDQNNALEPIPFRNLPAGVLYGASHLEKIDRAKNEELFTAQVGTFEGLKKECVKKLTPHGTKKLSVPIELMLPTAPKGS